MNKENNSAPISAYCRKVISNSLPDLAGGGASLFFTNSDEVDNKIYYGSHKGYSLSSIFSDSTRFRFPLFIPSFQFFLFGYDQDGGLLSPFLIIWNVPPNFTILGIVKYDYLHSFIITQIKYQWQSFKEYLNGRKR